jgi:predicted transcriptional regulator of viral defense system
VTRPTDQVLALAETQRVIRPQDLTSRGLSHKYLIQLQRQGRLERVGRGLYALPDRELSPNASFAQVCKRVPEATVCLLSALAFHQIGTQNPSEVWIALPGKSHAPRIDYPPVKIMRFSGSALTEGVEPHETSDGQIRVYSVAKTVVDCFRFRNKIGLDVALEALRDVLRERQAPIDEIWRYGKMLRMTNVMRPYLEAVV